MQKATSIVDGIPRVTIGGDVASVQPDKIDTVVVLIPGTLVELRVRDGQMVQQGQLLATLRDLDTERRIMETAIERRRNDNELSDLKRLRDFQGDASEEARGKLDQQITEAHGKWVTALKMDQALQIKKLRLLLKAPRTGVVMNPPRIDEVGKYYEEGAPFCRIGDPRYLRVLMPVSPADYRLLYGDLDKAHELPVTIRVQGRADLTWHGRISQLPESEAKLIPAALTNKGGGNIAVKPATKSDPDGLIPQSQQYLIGIDIVDSDNKICPGTMAQAKVHCRWRTSAWWAWRSFSAAFDIGDWTDYLPSPLRWGK